MTSANLAQARARVPAPTPGATPAAAFYRDGQISNDDAQGGAHIVQLPPVRARRRSGIRPLDLAQPVLASEAMHDKIKLRASACIGYASAEQMADYLAVVGDRSEYTPVVFHIRQGISPATRTLVSAPNWLFKATGRINNIDRETGGRANLHLDIDINPTRFLAHHPETLSLGILEAMPHAEALRESADLRNQTRAATLNDADNFLIGTLRRGGSFFDCRESRWQRVLGIYFSHVTGLVRDALVPNPTNALPQVQVSLDFDTVAQTEVYWEMETEDALATVAPSRRSHRPSHLPRRFAGMPRRSPPTPTARSSSFRSPRTSTHPSTLKLPTWSGSRCATRKMSDAMSLEGSKPARSDDFLSSIWRARTLLPV